ncbi:MAG: hypothetical protein E6Q97_18270 [Desulfurellales bacterium]|nr:MAG: hypothetical protein E6Q97_18270 [Desulfurellales bacterium]
MALITTGSHPKALWPGVKRWWGVEYNRYQPIWPKLFETLNSTQHYEEDVEDIGFGLLSTKGEGGGISYDTAHQGPVSRYTHITYGLGYMVSMEEMQDNLYEKVSFKRTSRLARSVYETEEVIHANIFNRAFTAGFTGGDGQVLISASHPTASGNQSNILTVAADLSEASIEDMVIQIRDATDSRGLRFNNKPRSLIVANADYFNAHRILKSVLQNDTANNAINVLKATGQFPDGIIDNVYLTDSDAWFIRTDCGEGLTHYTRMAPEFDKDNDFDTKNLKASVIMRFSVGWSNWRCLYGSAGA